MKKLIAAVVLAGAAFAVPAFADVGISIRIGDPGFYGQLDIGGYQPRLVYSRPVIVERRARVLEPIYVRVPPGQQRNWKRYCDRYRACNRPVYFVRDDWYRNEYAPRYRRQHEHDRHDHRDDHRDRHDDRHDHRDDHRDRHDDRHDHRDDHRDRHDDRHDHRDDYRDHRGR